MRTLSFAVVAILSISSSCQRGVNNKIDNIKTDNIISDNINADYEIGLNESFQLDLVSNPTTGYSWRWTNKQSVSIVDTFDYSFIPDSPILVGSGGKEIWKFKGIKSGVDSIKLEFCRSFEPNSTIDTKEIVVNVK